MRKRLKGRDESNRKDLRRRLQAAGIPVRNPQTDEVSLMVRQDIGALESSVFDFDGGTGMSLSLQITSDMVAFVFSGFDVRLGLWPEGIFLPLEENVSAEWPHYEFSGLSDQKFHRNQTINRFIADRRQFRRGEVLRGLLLGWCPTSMPDSIFRGVSLHGSVIISDQFERVHPAPISLRVHRHAKKEIKLNPLRRPLIPIGESAANSSGAEGEPEN